MVTKTTAQVIGELDALYMAGWRGRAFFVDDNFMVLGSIYDAPGLARRPTGRASFRKSHILRFGKPAQRSKE
jgi:hypothetical protein